ncbi:MAG: PAS domain-containing protein, partial [Gemmatimonadota bacterium]|nr:PAS domain-containing protein [Gemmatimonadota bacterium]
MSQIVPDPTHPDDADARLRRSEELLRSAQQLARVGSWEWEVGSETVTWSDELYRIFGRDPAGGPVVYAEYLGYLHPDDRPVLGAAIERAIKLGEAFEVEHRLVRRDGSIRWVLGRGGRIAGADGRAVRLIGTAQDVTERREAEETRRRLA